MKPDTTKRYLVESAPDPDGEWARVMLTPEYTNPEAAELEFHRQDELRGHDTYHRLVEVRRKVLKCR